MHFRSIALALLLSTFAGVVVASTAMRPSVLLERSLASDAAARQPADCHRDVRTHRIFGVMIRHRHVGKNCSVREVRRLRSY